jgi:hypothetical protein
MATVMVMAGAITAGMAIITDGVAVIITAGDIITIGDPRRTVILTR